MKDDTQNDAGNEAAEQETVTPPTPENSAELDELRRENEELKQAARLRTARELMIAELKTAGARSPGLMFDTAIADVQFDDAGEPVNIAALVANLKTKFPEQFGTDAPSDSIDAGAGSGARPNFLTPETLARMKPNEIAKLDWTEVRSVLASQ
jgi:hypothetical protein